VSQSSSWSFTNLDTSRYKQASYYFTLEEYEIADTSLKGLYLCIREAAKRMIVSSTTQEQESKGKKIAVNNNTTYAIISISSSYDSSPRSEADEYTFHFLESRSKGFNQNCCVPTSTSHFPE